MTYYKYTKFYVYTHTNMLNKNKTEKNKTEKNKKK